MTQLAEEVIEARSGPARWRATRAVGLRLWAGGIAFRSEGDAQTLHDVSATVAIGHPRVILVGRYAYPSQHPFGELPRRSTAWRGRWSVDQIAESAAGALWTYVDSPLLPFLDEVGVEVPTLVSIRRQPPPASD